VSLPDLAARVGRADHQGALFVVERLVERREVRERVDDKEKAKGRKPKPDAPKPDESKSDDPQKEKPDSGN
jgi:hypothetical protein